MFALSVKLVDGFFPHLIKKGQRFKENVAPTMHLPPVSKKCFQMYHTYHCSLQ
jgi:hypothetical protein